MYDWQPPRFGEKRDNEVSCWAFGLSHGLREVPKVAKAIKELEGFVGIYPNAVYGSLIIFKTKIDAIRGRNELKDRFPCGGIGEVFVEEQYLNENSRE